MNQLITVFRHDPVNDEFFDTFLINGIKEIMWVYRYNSPGEFSITCMCSDDILKNVFIDSFIRSNNLPGIMVVEEIDRIYNEEYGYELVIKGRSLESVFERRVVSNERKNSGIKATIKNIFDSAWRTPLSADNRKEDHFTYSFLPELTPEQESTALYDGYYGQNCLEALTDICSSLEFGYKFEIIDNKTFTFTIYSGAEKDHIIFSEEFMNILNSSFLKSDSLLKNAAIVIGEETSSGVEKISYEPSMAYLGPFVSLKRREIFVDGSDVSHYLPDEAVTYESFKVTNDNGIFDPDKEYYEYKDTYKSVDHGEPIVGRTYWYQKDDYVQTAFNNIVVFDSSKDYYEYNTSRRMMLPTTDTKPQKDKAYYHYVQTVEEARFSEDEYGNKSFESGKVYYEPRPIGTKYPTDRPDEAPGYVKTKDPYPLDNKRYYVRVVKYEKAEIPQIYEEDKDENTGAFRGYKTTSDESAQSGKKYYKKNVVWKSETFSNGMDFNPNRTYNEKKNERVLTSDGKPIKNKQYYVKNDRYTDEEYRELLRNKAIEELLGQDSEILIDAELNSYIGYDFGTDYFVGDIVYVHTNGWFGKARVTEYTYNETPDSVTEHPTFKIIGDA